MKQYLTVTFDREPRRKQKEMLRAIFPDYDPRRHDAFVDLYNKQVAIDNMNEYMANRNI